MTYHQKNLTIILNDLYKVDPSLREHEPELIRLINELIKSKPEAALDERFRKQLRDKILKMAKEIKLSTKANKKDFPWGITLMSQFLKPVGYAVIGAVVLALIVVPIMWSKQKIAVESPFAFQVTETEENAFGKLAFGGTEASEEALGRGGGGAVPVPSLEQEVAVGEAPAAMPMPIKRVNYTYIYKGDEFSVEEATMKVFQRVKNGQAGSALASYLSKVKFEGLDLSKFQNANLQYFTLVEDKDFGYLISVNVAEGEISINKNWTKWDMEELKQIEASEMPEEAEVIAVANQFISNYGLDFQNYGEPEISSSWKVYYQRAKDEGYPISGVMDVVYPLLIDSQQVFERSGQKAGVHINVDLKEMKVASVWGLKSQQYQSSLYETETDTARILELAEKGTRTFNFDNPDQTLEFELGTPQMIYTRVTNYEERKMQEFLVPALSFPVVKAPSEVEYYQKSVIVPLIKDMLEQELNPPMPRPVMPLPEGN